MRFIPTHCESCSRAALVDASAINAGLTPCADCGASARSLPGESYGEEDVALYHDVVATLRDAGVTPFQARQLAMDLEIKSLLEPGRCLRRLVQTLPTLGALELLVENEPLALRKLEGMLAILLEVMGSSRSESGVVFTSEPSKAGGERG
jgi:hypothetical protein